MAFSVTLNETSYYFNPCKTFNIPINGDPHTVQGEQCHNVLGCKKIRRTIDSEEYFTVAIRHNSMIVTKNSNLTIRYYGAK